MGAPVALFRREGSLCVRSNTPVRPLRRADDRSGSTAGRSKSPSKASPGRGAFTHAQTLLQFSRSLVLVQQLLDDVQVRHARPDGLRLVDGLHCGGERGCARVSKGGRAGEEGGRPGRGKRSEESEDDDGSLSNCSQFGAVSPRDPTATHSRAHTRTRAHALPTHSVHPRAREKQRRGALAALLFFLVRHTRLFFPSLPMRSAAPPARTPTNMLSLR